MKNLLSLLLPMLFLALSFNACEKDPCSNVACLNGGTCINGACDCPSDYSGLNCQDFDPCHNVTCLNGGTCVNGACDCPTGYSGIDCSVLLTPTSMTITRIDITDYPVTQSNGSGWDPFDGADPFVSFNSGTTANQNDYTSGYKSNVTGQTLSYTTNLPITIPNLNIDWILGLWDLDASAHDFMDAVYFKPINKTTGFPSTFVIGHSTISARIHVTWNF